MYPKGGIFTKEFKLLWAMSQAKETDRADFLLLSAFVAEKLRDSRFFSWAQRGSSQR
jgi:hypothetical protein